MASVLTAKDVQLELDKARAENRAPEFGDTTITGIPAGADLTDANFTGATLKGLDFGAATVARVAFTSADLMEADLSQVIGLIPRQLAGADLTRCNLPDKFPGFTLLNNVNDLSKLAATVGLATLVSCAFVLLVAFTTKDYDFLTNHGTATIPLVNLAVPPRVFFGISPFVILAQTITFHFYLQRLWDLTALLPARFQDGMTIDDVTYPWLLNDLSRLVFRRLNWTRVAQVLGSVIVAYGAMPATQFLIYLRCRPRHDESLAIWQISVTIATFGWITYSLLYFRATRARYVHHRVAEGRVVPRTTPWGVRRFVLAISLGVTALVGFVMGWDWYTVSVGAPADSRVGLTIHQVEGDLGSATNFLQRVPSGSAARNDADEALAHLRSVHADLKRRSSIAPIIPSFDALGTVPNLNDDVSGRPTSWHTVADFHEQQKIIAGVAPVVFRRNTYAENSYVERQPLSLAFLKAHGAFLVNADFRYVDLLGADFSGANLEASVWSDYTVSIQTGRPVTAATLDGADFTNADLCGADLGGCSMDLASLSYAAVHHANLASVSLVGADCTAMGLTDSVLDQANFTGATLARSIVRRSSFKGATLVGAQAQFVDFTGSDFSDAHLAFAHFGDSNFTGCRLAGADLTGATLTGAHLSGADLSGATLTGADFKRADTRRANFQGAVVGAANTLAPDVLASYQLNPNGDGTFTLTLRKGAQPRPAARPDLDAGTKDPKHPASPFPPPAMNVRPGSRGAGR